MKKCFSNAWSISILLKAKAGISKLLAGAILDKETLEVDLGESTDDRQKAGSCESHVCGGRSVATSCL